MTPQEMADIIVLAIKTATAPLVARIGHLEGQTAVVPRNGIDGINGLNGVDGKDADMGVLASLVASEVSRMMGLMPPAADGINGRDGKDGAPGLDGKDGLAGQDGRPGQDGAPGRPGEAGPSGPAGVDAPAVDLPHLAKLASALIERPKDGIDGAAGRDGAAGAAGRDGIDGRDGHDGKDSDPLTVALLVRDEVAKAVSQIRVPKDGQSVTVSDIAPLVASEVTKAVAALPRPTEPVSVVGALVERDGTLVLTCSDGETKRVGIVVGKDGAPGRDGVDVEHSHLASLVQAAVDLIPRPTDGRDGVDGVGFDDVALEFDDQTGFALAFHRGETVKAFPLPTPFYAGIWESGRRYPRSAQVTAKGAQWIALRDTQAKPGEDDEASRDWKLCVKAGRDGKPGRDGRDGGAL